MQRPKENHQRFDNIPIVLGILTVLLHLPFLGWGLPSATAPDRTKTFATDEILPLEALAEMRNTFVESRPDRNYSYPWWHYFVVASAQAPYVAYLWISGGLAPSGPEFPFGLSDPIGALKMLTLIGRCVTVAMSGAIVVAAFYFSKILWGRLAGVVGALLTMLNYLMFYYSRTGNLDVPMFFWTSIGLVIFARILQSGFTVRRAAWLGVFTALAIATKDQAITIFLPLGCVLLLPSYNCGTDSRYRVAPILAGFGAAILTYLVSTGMVFDPERHVTHVQKLLFTWERLVGPEETVTNYFPKVPRTLAGSLELFGVYIQSLIVTMSVPTFIVGLAGALLAVRKSPRHLVLLLPIAGLFLIVTLPMGISVRRYLLPMTLLVDSFAAFTIVGLYHSKFRAAWVPIVAVLAGWRVMMGVDLTYAQCYDSRYAAADWLKAHAQPGDIVQYFGSTQKLPHLPAEVNTQRVGEAQTNVMYTGWKGRAWDVPDALDSLREADSEYLVVIPDWTSYPGMVHSQDCPPQIFEALTTGSLGLTQAAYFPPQSLLGSWLQRPHLDNPSVCPPVRIFARSSRLNPIDRRVKGNSTGRTSGDGSP